jgi:hypothetical protein
VVSVALPVLVTVMLYWGLVPAGSVTAVAVVSASYAFAHRQDGAMCITCVRVPVCDEVWCVGAGAMENASMHTQGQLGCQQTHV